MPFCKGEHLKRRSKGAVGSLCQNEGRQRMDVHCLEDKDRYRERNEARQGLTAGLLNLLTDVPARALDQLTAQLSMLHVHT